MVPFSVMVIDWPAVSWIRNQSWSPKVSSVPVTEPPTLIEAVVVALPGMSATSPTPLVAMRRDVEPQHLIQFIDKILFNMNV